MQNKIKILISISLLFIVQAYGLIDAKNANYTKTFIDIAFQNKGIPFVIERTYNSRSLYKGIFGHGWCSNLETKLAVMPDNTLMVTECGGGVEIPYISSHSKINSSHKIKAIMSKVKNTKGLSKKYIKQVEQDLKNSSLLQSELIRAFDLKGKAKTGKIYKAVGRQNNSIQFTGKEYKRFLSNGRIQFFNKKGLLTKTIDKSGHWIKIQRKNNKIVKLMDNKGRNLRFKTKKNTLTIMGSHNIKSTYFMKKGNLVRVKNSTKDSYQYKYDDFHNLKSSCYSDGSCEYIGYNTRRDWVISFTDRRLCTEKYTYKTNKRNSNHYWTKVIKKCGKQVTNNSVYEFWNKKKSNGSKYLYRARQKVNGAITDITYYKKTGSPKRITKDNMTSYYTYYTKGKFNGFLKSMVNSQKKIIFPNYDKKCKKPKKLIVQYMQNKKIKKQIETKITYNPIKCHLIKAQNDLGRWVIVNRDHKGRIREMTDQSKKRIIITYNKKYNKPEKITRPGVGSIFVSYDKSGNLDIKKVKSNPTVVAQITSVFNGFIEIISPVVTYVSI